MPLIHSKSDKAFKRNVRTLMRDIGKSPHVQSKRQALAIAFSTQRRGKQAGGAVGFAMGGRWLDPTQAQMDPLTTEIDRQAAGITRGAVSAGPGPVRAYHGSTERNLKRLSPEKGIETRGATFHATNPDVAETFTFPREYGEMLYYHPVTGRELKRGRVYETELTPKSLYEVPPGSAQKFIDDTAYQGEVIRGARAAGHDAVVARDVLEGIGELYKGDVYATLRDDIAKIIKKYGFAAAAALMGLGSESKAADKAQGGSVMWDDMQAGGVPRQPMAQPQPAAPQQPSFGGFLPQQAMQQHPLFQMMQRFNPQSAQLAGQQVPPGMQRWADRFQSAYQQSPFGRLGEMFSRFRRHQYAEGGKIKSDEQREQEELIAAAGALAEDTPVMKALRLPVKKPPKKQGGGKISSEFRLPWAARTAMYGLRPNRSKPLIGPTPGRADKRPENVASGSYVIPSDVVAAIGQGNSLAGMAKIKKKFAFGKAFGGEVSKRFQGSKMESYGGGRFRMPGVPGLRRGKDFALGGTPRDVPIAASDGEHILTPEEVTAFGKGDIKRGHDMLDKWVLSERKKHIEQLKRLKGPKKD